MKKTIWIKSAAIMLAMCAICLFDVYAGPGSGGGGGGMSIYDGEPTEADCRACHDDLVNFPMLLATNPDKHHIVAVLEPENCSCLGCHTIVWDVDLVAYVVSDTNCLVCHEVYTIEGGPGAGSSNRHHDTESFGTSCFICHQN